MYLIQTLRPIRRRDKYAQQTLVELFFDLLTWLTGLAAVWLLWRPASSAFFKSARAARSRG